MRLIKYLFILLMLVIGIVTVYLFDDSGFIGEKKDDSINAVENAKVNTDYPLEISGWIAWWKEAEAYDLIQKYSAQITNVSPVWFYVNKDLDLINVGDVDRLEVTRDMKNFEIDLVPSLGSELDSEQLSLFLNDADRINVVVENLISQLVSLNVQGVDIDLEKIKKEDKDAFSQFLLNLSKRLKEENINLYVAVHAQTEKVEWEGVLGQDLGKIGDAADYVRIMTYDRHSCSNGPGAISPIDWMKDVALYNSNFIDAEKIVIGIPSYSYVWAGDECISLQYDELKKYLEGKSYTQKRDNESKELVFESEDFTAWLSDSEAMMKKIEGLREIGYDKFVIWSLGGMDEKLFSEQNVDTTIR